MVLQANLFLQTNLKDESEEYQARRDELRVAEIELMRRRKPVAAMRRALPRGTAVEDYIFEEGPSDFSAGAQPLLQVPLSEFFSAVDRPLVIYHLMYGKKQTNPCPMCTILIDGYNGVAHHIKQNVDLAIAAAADLPSLRAHARARGWNRLRLLSCGTNRFKSDLKSEDAEGRQDSTISVFTKDADGSVLHFYTAHPSMAEDIHSAGSIFSAAGL